ncbi:MAG: LA_2272 family surface repeat-containing protein [bacterium]
MKKLLFAFFISIFITSGAAARSPIQLSITPDIALVNRYERVEGLSLGIWSENPQTAITLGIVSGSRGQSAGFSYGLLGNYAENYKGIHWGIVNYTSNEFLGWQSGLVNFTEGKMTGLQTGTVNYAKRLHGLQWGFVNYAETADFAVQIGLINLLAQNEFFTNFPSELAPAMFIVNWKF